MSRPKTRREFLNWAAAAGLGCAGIAPPSRAAGDRPDSLKPTTGRSPLLPPRDRRKLIVVVFGGGARNSETIDDPEHRHIPNLWQRMAPRGTLFTNMRVEHRVVHPNCNGSIKTGHWEWDHLDWSRPVAHPTIFEIVRRERRAPDTAAWAFVYASILAGTGLSEASGYGLSAAANVVAPPTIPRATAEAMTERMMRAARQGSPEAEMEAAADCARLARETSRIATGGLRSDAARSWLGRQFDGWKSGDGTTSHDAFLTDLAAAAMRDFSPDVISVDYGEIDSAHYGSWSRYVEAIRRTDALVWRLWQTVESLADYRRKTLMLILPDHGRQLEGPGSAGFIHHSDFYTNQGADEGCRRVWMLALGPGVAAGRTIARPTPITAAAATGLEYLDLEASPGATKSVLPLLASS